VYEWDGESSRWVQLGADIDGEAGVDGLYGWSVAMSAEVSRIIIGSLIGPTRVYEWDGENRAWGQLGADIDGEAAGDYSGWSVAMSADGRGIIIGAPLNDGAGDYRGHARVYAWNGSKWDQVGADIDGEAATDQSGWSVGMSANGSRFIIGAPYNDGNGDNSGHALVYEWDGIAWDKLGPDINGEAAGDYSGYSVAMSADGSRIIIGAPRNDGAGDDSGHARVYEWDQVNSGWVQLGDDIDGEAADDLSGWSVAMSEDGSRIIIGAPFNDGNGEDSGHGRVYEWNGSAWAQLGDDIDGEAGNTGGAGDQSGYSVAMSADGSRFIIGAPYNDGNGIFSGHARVYEAFYADADENLDTDGDGYTPVSGGDCDDEDASINPGAYESDDGVDNNCDGAIDEGFDTDGDGYTPVFGRDCDDDNASINPGVYESDDGVDNNCDGAIHRRRQLHASVRSRL
jgi:hypothetical protein